MSVTPHETERLEALETQVAALKAALSLQKRLSPVSETELLEFERLFPDVPFHALPDKVWESARKGVPLSAAYALELHKAQMTRRAAALANQRAGAQTPGALRGAAETYFSPDEVRAMNRDQIRDQMTAIRESMKKWN